MANAIQLSGLKKSFRHPWSLKHKPVLHGLDLEVREGKIFGFLGPNGAGKTTTLKILVGLVAATEGSAWVLGRPASEAAARQEVGFLPENPYFYEYLTPEESLRFYGSLFRLHGAGLQSQVQRLLEEFDLERARKQRIRTFSKGMRQRLGMAQALIGSPRLVILDEPQSGLDPIGRYRIKEAISRLAAQGVTVFFSSHILADVEDLCDEIGLLLGGRLAQSGPLRQLLASQSQRFELQFRGLTPQAARELAAGGIHGSFGSEIFTVQTSRPEEVGALLDRVRAAGGQVVALHPVRESLEEYFVRMTSNSGS
jgi:ABC-2 type transport system ATP-binding protein